MKYKKRYNQRQKEKVIVTIKNMITILKALYI
jgi:hypothetical protein